MRTMHEKNSATGKTPADENEARTHALVDVLKRRGHALGFSAIGIARPDLSAVRPALRRWLAQGYHGGMDYMAKHADLRTDPDALLPGTLSIICARLPYWPQEIPEKKMPADRQTALISRYALGRDYHKTVRQRLQKLADTFKDAVHTHFPETAMHLRVFSDSAPVMEVELARQAGIGWRGKNTLSLTRTGSWHFLGEIYTTFPLPPDTPGRDHCGRCRRCLDACPTQAIVAPYEVDARRCISYLTIELAGAIPPELRPLIGNRIYGCDDCQLCCPWNTFARAADPDFAVRHGLDAQPLTELFSWDEATFNDRLAGSPIRRIGHERWLRNIAVALGNSNGSPDIRRALESRCTHPSALVREHVAWALAQLAGRS